MDDVRAVLDAVGSERAALFGISEGGPMSVLFAATYPQRTSSLILYGSIAKGSWAPDYPWGSRLEEIDGWLEDLREKWGGPYGIDFWAPSAAHDEQFRQWWAKYLRLGASPSAVTNIFRMNTAIDVREILPAIRKPTLVMHRTGDQAIEIEQGRFLAQHIPGAKLRELDGNDHLWWVGDSDAISNEIQEFLTGERQAVESDRVLATLLFTDIVDSTKRVTELGDSRWRDLLARHDSVMNAEIKRFRGRTIKTTGDGFLATFDGPARAIQCALSARTEMQRMGIEVRAALHTGEIELIGDDVGGIAVHMAARILAEAGAGEVWTSGTVKDLVIGSSLKFSDRGTHNLKGLSGDWPLHAVEV